MDGKKKIYTADKDNAIDRLLRFIEACPQIIKPGIGFEALVDDLIRAATKYAEFASPIGERARGGPKDCHRPPGI